MGADRCQKIEEALQAFALDGAVKAYERYGSGHINDTFRMTCEKDGKEIHYILQRMNTEVFKDPVSLMKNIIGVTSFMRKKIIEQGGDPERETLNLVPTKDGKLYFVDSINGYWRVYLFIEDTACYDLVEKPEDFYNSGKAFGHFQRLLSEYPAKELTETIQNFHNTPVRFETFQKAVEEDICGRRKDVEKEIQFVRDRAGEMGKAMDMLAEGRLPLRVTHNDTKLNNIMFDKKSGDALCIIDLDTIMPGLSIFDFGDSIRFGANTGAEDEPDLSKVSMSLELFELYTKGFLEGCQGSLTKEEVDMLPMGAKLMTLECGMRFLTDYLQGDVYFHTTYPEHNLVRCHTQFEMVADMERKWAQMEEIVKRQAENIR